MSNDIKQVKMRIHSVHMDNRERASISGVNEVESFNEGEVVLETEQGLMIISGENLHISRLNLEEGQLIVEGLIGGIEYEQSNSRGGLFSRMFR